MSKKEPAKKASPGTKEREFLARVYVSLKPTVNDPEGNTILSALGSLGLDGFTALRSGKFFRVTVRAKDAKQAAKFVDAACSRLLANPVIETYEFELAEA